MTQRHTPIAALAASIAVAALTGCSSITDVFEQVHSESFDSRSDAESGWVGVTMPDWLPDDAADIRTTATMNESNAVIAFTGGEPTGCSVDARSTMPFDGRYGGFADAADLPDDVRWCGRYEVHEMPAGWLAWFNAAEVGQTPES